MLQRKACHRTLRKAYQKEGAASGDGVADADAADVDAVGLAVWLAKTCPQWSQ